jgi:hypothetical protein
VASFDRIKLVELDGFVFFLGLLDKLEDLEFGVVFPIDITDLELQL